MADRLLRQLAADAVSLAFAVPKELSDDYSFVPGQYLTLRTTMDGEEVRRSYSICSGPDDGEPPRPVEPLCSPAAVIVKTLSTSILANKEFPAAVPLGRP